MPPALLVLEDWAQGATFDQAGIDAERGIVLSEWRMRLGAEERTGDKIRRVQLEGSRYADRPPIGKPEVIEHVQREQLTRFYRDWYRPDLMAVIVVGDVNPGQVFADVTKAYADWKPSKLPVIHAEPEPTPTPRVDIAELQRRRREQLAYERGFIATPGLPVSGPRGLESIKPGGPMPV